MRATINKIITFSILSFCINFPGFAQNESLFADVRSALKAGSSKELSKYFHETIELNINDEVGNYSNVHAEIYLKEFFKKYEPISFEYAHQGSSNEGLKFAIGNYVHANGAFLVLIRVKKFAEKERIYIIDFSKE